MKIMNEFYFYELKVYSMFKKLKPQTVTDIGYL